MAGPQPHAARVRQSRNNGMNGMHERVGRGARLPCATCAPTTQAQQQGAGPTPAGALDGDGQWCHFAQHIDQERMIIRGSHCTMMAGTTLAKLLRDHDHTASEEASNGRHQAINAQLEYRDERVAWL